TARHLLIFYQAEDCIRDRNVTGVQTCALPILIPAVATAAITGSATRAPCSNTINVSFIDKRDSLRMKLTKYAERIPNIAARCGVKPIIIVLTIIKTGSSI